MATYKSFNQIDMREINFHEDWTNAETYRLRNNTGFDDPPLNRFYSDALVLSDGDAINSRTFFYGDNITISSRGAVTGGTIGAVVDYFTQDGRLFFSSSLLNASFSAVALYNAQVSSSTTDDKALLGVIYRGNDNITLSRFNDWFDGGAGNDTMKGGNGSDTLVGNSGADRIIGGARGADRLDGSSGNDVLSGGGGTGRDVFVFRNLGDLDRITDFVDGRDRIEIQGLDGSNTVRVRDRGADAEIIFGSSLIIVEDIDHRLITAADFIFT